MMTPNEIDKEFRKVIGMIAIAGFILVLLGVAIGKYLMN